MSQLTFKRVMAGPFQGINKDNPIVIEFPKVAPKTKKRPIIRVSGDAGLCKSSLINSLLYACRHNLEFNKSNLVNLASDEMAGEEIFDRDGETWKIAYTKTKFELFRLFETDDDSGWIPQGDIHTHLKKLIGNIAVSPMKLRTDDGKKQVEWLFNMLNVPADVVIEAKKLSEAINNLSSHRTPANKEYEYLKKSLSENPMYRNWEESEKKYRQVKTIESAKKSFEVAAGNKVKYGNAKNNHEAARKKVTEKEKDIVALQEKLELAQQELKVFKKNEQTAADYLEKHKGVEKHYEVVHQEFMSISNYLAEQAAWLRVKEDKKNMDEFETAVQDADARKNTLKTKKRDLLKKIIPDIDGFEVYTDDEIDGHKAGIYLLDRNPIQLSESELFDLYFKLCRAQGVSMVVIENITSFGTDVVKTLNAMAKAGVYIWATEMVRGQKELKIEFIDELK